MITLDLQTLIIAVIIGAASGAIGAFIILRRMALVGDALSHVALPGIALALAYHFDPFWGVVAFCLAAALVVWSLEEKTRLYSDALIGLLFTFSLAIGVLMIPDTEILESLFGAFTPLSLPEFFFISIAGIASIILIFLYAKHFLFLIISPELASIRAPRRSKLFNLLLMVLFAFIVSLGIKLVGTLLMGALTIIPATISKNISRSMSGYIVISTILGGCISLLGVIAAGMLHFIPGPTIIILGIALFGVSLFFVRNVR